MRTNLYTGLLILKRKDPAWRAVRRGLRYLIPLCLPVLVTAPAGSQVPARKYPAAPSGTDVVYAKKVLQGFDMRVWISNQMTIGQEAWDGLIFGQFPPFGCEYPAGSGIEHIFGAGPWIGGIVNGARHVSEGYNGNDATKYLLPDIDHPLRELIWRTSVADSLTEPNRRGCDDDGDGRTDEDDLDGLDNDGDWNGSMDDVGADGLADINETGCHGGYDLVANPDPAFDNYSLSALDYCHPDAQGNFRLRNDPDLYTEHNGLADHGEPNVDEDYGAVSDNDLYCSASDTNQPAAGHFPMGIKVIQKSYAWRDPLLGAVIPFEYSFINTSDNIIRDVYVGYFMDADVGPIDAPSYFQKNYACYIPELRMAYVHNPIDRGSTPIGLMVLETPKAIDSLDFIFQWFNFTTRLIPFQDDSTLYAWMSGEATSDPVAECQSPTSPEDTRFILSVGPFDEMRPGDTLKVTFALVSGFSVASGKNSMTENATRILFHHGRGWRFSSPPPSPALRAVQENHRVKLEWGPSVGGADPASYWDPANMFVSSYPADHWRRAGPPCGGVLPGFGCDSPVPCDSAGMYPGGRTFEGYRIYRSEDQGQPPPLSSFVLLHDYDMAGDEFGFNNGLDTVFEDEDLPYDKRYWYAVTSYSIPDMKVVQIGADPPETLRTPGVESPFTSNMVRVDLSARASEGPNGVMVVPNPSYDDRITFIHLPRSCTIRIYTVAGDVVTTLRYQSPADDPDRGELKWYLVSESGRPLSSDLYLYTIESRFGTQIGKFVVIR